MSTTSLHIEAAIAAWRSMATNGDRMFDPTFVSDTRIEAGPITAHRDEAGWVVSLSSSYPAEWLVRSAKWLESCLSYEECFRARKMIESRFPYLILQAGSCATSLKGLREIWKAGVRDEEIRKAVVRDEEIRKGGGQ